MAAGMNAAQCLAVQTDDSALGLLQIVMIVVSMWISFLLPFEHPTERKFCSEPDNTKAGTFCTVAICQICHHLIHTRHTMDVKQQ
jgi:hypothetical protein